MKRQWGDTRVGKNPPPNTPGSKLHPDDVYIIRYYIKRKVSHRAIARIFKVSPTAISNINLRKTWRHIK